MSLLSRNTRGGRRSVASMAAVFVGTLLTYLVVTAVPAFAQTTCTFLVDTVTLNIGTDDVVALVIDDGSFGGAVGDIIAIENNTILVDCGAATDLNTGIVNATGSGAGNETLMMVETGADDWDDQDTTVNLLAGNDTLTFEYGEFSAAIAPDTAGDETIADPASGQDIDFGTNANGNWAAQDGGGTADLRITNAETVIVNLGDGPDQVDTSSGISDFIAPANLVTGPPTFPFTANGEQGEDELESGLGNDVINGGPGDDEIDFDAIDEAGGSVGATVDLGAGTASGGAGNDVLTDIQDVDGSDQADNITGSAVDNDLSGDGGNDVISGLAGDDDISGGDDDDTLTGGAGDDDVDGNDGDDMINEEAAANGADSLDGGGTGTDIDTLNYGARTTSTIVVADGGAVSGQDANADGDASDAGDERDDVAGDFEVFITGSGNDRLFGDVNSADDEVFKPQGGDDFVDGNGGTDLFDVSEATAATTVNLELGTINGNGADTFVEVEQFATGTGDDVLIPDIQTGLPPIATFDWFADGGIDLIDGSTNTGGFAVDLSILGDPGAGPGGGCSGTPSPSVQDAGAGSCLIVENATGGAGNDTLIGGPGSNVLIGGDGIDIINGDAGNDTVVGGAGNDNLGGGTGADTLSYVDAPSGEVIDLQLGFASGGDGDDAIGFFEIVFGSNFRDDITGGQTAFDFNLRIRGRGGNDVITGSNSSDVLAGGRGRDLVRAGGGDDILRLGGGNDIGAGGSGDDILRGASGNDRLLGGGGDDFLFGGRGHDVGRGGGGDDTCRTEERRSC